MKVLKSLSPFILLVVLIWQSCTPPDAAECDLPTTQFSISNSINIHNDTTITIITAPLNTCVTDLEDELGCKNDIMFFQFEFWGCNGNLISTIKEQLNFNNSGASSNSVEWEIAPLENNQVQAPNGNVITTLGTSLVPDLYDYVTVSYYIEGIITNNPNCDKVVNGNFIGTYITHSLDVNVSSGTGLNIVNESSTNITGEEIAPFSLTSPGYNIHETNNCPTL